MTIDADKISPFIHKLNPFEEIHIRNPPKKKKKKFCIAEGPHLQLCSHLELTV